MWPITVVFNNKEESDSRNDLRTKKRVLKKIVFNAFEILI